MEDKLTELKEILAEIDDLNKASSVLGWDMQANMPASGAEARGFQLATLSRISHEKFTSEKVGKLLEELEEYIKTLDPDSNDARLHKITKRNYTKAIRVPSEMVAEISRVTSIANQAWVEARQKSDFSIFEPHLVKIVDLIRKYADLFSPYDHVYDPLLDDYEPGMKTVDVQTIFDAIRPKQSELIKAIASQTQVEDSFLHVHYDYQKQWDFSKEVITELGYDWERGLLSKVPHPFMTNLGYGDIRINTRVDENFFNTCIFGTVHETGHALYELNMGKELSRTPLFSGASYALHESQSRLYENLVGRSLPFWEHFYPRLQEIFPQQLANVDVKTFYKGINKVHPSFIRVEADEATYNMHIIIRMEIEIALMEGNLEVKDLPEAWNSKMEQYLGITPPDDAKGVLQDVHWSYGNIGYFPTYALGTMIASQLWEKLKEDLPDVSDQIRKGEFQPMLGWLMEKIHQHGAKFEPQELIHKITGSYIDGEPYLKYLNNKFGAIYNL
jgi:carboxypeptidase Taq